MSIATKRSSGARWIARTPPLVREASLSPPRVNLIAWAPSVTIMTSLSLPATFAATSSSPFPSLMAMRPLERTVAKLSAALLFITPRLVAIIIESPGTNSVTARISVTRSFSSIEINFTSGIPLDVRDVS